MHWLAHVSEEVYFTSIGMHTSRFIRVLHQQIRFKNRAYLLCKIRVGKNEQEDTSD